MSAGQEQGPISAVFLGIIPKQNLSPCGIVLISNWACEVESSVREWEALSFSTLIGFSVDLPSLGRRAVVGGPNGEGVGAAHGQVDTGQHSDHSCEVIDGEVSLIPCQDFVAHHPVGTLISVHCCQLKKWIGGVTSERTCKGAYSHLSLSKLPLWTRLNHETCQVHVRVMFARFT